MELVQGNHACVKGALRAGVRFFGGYPITPSSEIAEEMSRQLPRFGGVFMQMEDEMGSLGACIGARLAGFRAMTATSGPGFSLMQEHVGFAAMTEVPVLIVNVMRGGPSTGLPTKLGQQDLMQAQWGSHGDYPMVAFVPWSVAEFFELTVKAVNTSEFIRGPVVVLSDEVIAHMREGMEFPEEVEVYDPAPVEQEPGAYLHYADGTEYNAPMASYGQGYRFHVTGLAHGKDGFPTNDPETISWMMDRLARKISDNLEYLTDYAYEGPEDPEILLVAVGSVARSSVNSMRQLEAEGVRVGLLRPRILWPFPENALSRFDGKVSAVIVPEQNQGQLLHPVREVIKQSPIYGIHKYNGELMSPQEILMGIKKHLSLKEK